MSPDQRRHPAKAVPGVGVAAASLPEAQMRRPFRPVEMYPPSLEPTKAALEIGPRRRRVKGKSLGGPGHSRPEPDHGRPDEGPKAY
jgi:hypothetical protein